MQSTYIAYRLLKELLHRTTGIRRDASFPTVVFTTGVLTAAFSPFVAPLFKVLRTRPQWTWSLANVMTAEAGVRYAVRSIQGDQARDTPLGGMVIAASLVAPLLHLINGALRRVGSAGAALARALRALRRLGF